MEAKSSVWFGCTLRGDNEEIRIGEGSKRFRRTWFATRTWAIRL